MNEIYALDPECTRDWKDLKLLLDKFGLSMGRFIAQYPEDWRDMVLRHFKNSSEIDRKRVVELISRSHRSTLPVSLEFRRAMGWPDNAVRVQEIRRPFARIISSTDQPPALDSVTAVLFDEQKDLADGRGAHIPMTVVAYVRAVMPLLRHSAEVYVVDRYFRLRRGDGSPDHRHAAVLVGLLEAAQASGKCAHLILVTDPDKALESGCGEPSWEEDLESALDKANAARVNISYLFPKGMDHGRYIFSIHGGLQFDYGFEKKTQGDPAKNHVHWLSQAELEPLILKYVERSPK